MKPHILTNVELLRMNEKQREMVNDVTKKWESALDRIAELEAENRLLSVQHFGDQVAIADLKTLLLNEKEHCLGHADRAGKLEALLREARGWCPTAMAGITDIRARIDAALRGTENPS